MTTGKQIEALKLALEALELYYDLHEEEADLKAITAIREALAEQPAQQQEPVATVTSESGNPNVSMSWWHEPALPVGTKLYTSPPASKPKNVMQVKRISDQSVELVFTSCAAASEFEAKLREKNA